MGTTTAGVECPQDRGRPCNRQKRLLQGPRPAVMAVVPSQKTLRRGPEPDAGPLISVSLAGKRIPTGFIERVNVCYCGEVLELYLLYVQTKVRMQTPSSLWCDHPSLPRARRSTSCQSAAVPVPARRLLVRVAITRPIRQPGIEMEACYTPMTNVVKRMRSRYFTL